MLNTSLYSYYHDPSHDYFMYSKLRIQCLRDILKKIELNWGNFKKNQMEINKTIRGLKNIYEGHFRVEQKVKFKLF